MQVSLSRNNSVQSTRFLSHNNSAQKPLNHAPTAADSFTFSDSNSVDESSFFGKLKKKAGESLPFVGGLIGAGVGAALGAAGGVIGGVAGAVAGVSVAAGAVLGTFLGAVSSFGQESALAGIALFVVGAPVVGAIGLAVAGPALAAGGALGAIGGVLGGAVGAAGGAVLGAGGGMGLREYLAD